MTRPAVQTVVGGLAAVIAFGCSKGPHDPGQESFLSPSPLGGAVNRGLANGDPTVGMASPNSGASAQTARSITEPDIYKVVGNTVFVLNQYRGFQIADATDPAHPRLLSAVALAGRPQDLYVLDKVAVVVVSDYFDYRLAPLASSVAPWRGSRVVAIDVSDPTRAAILGSLEIDGDVQESRIVGNILYVFSQRWAWYVNPGSSDTRELTFVASFDVSNAGALRSVDRIEFPASGWNTHANITPDRAILSQSGWENTGPITHFQVIDLSDPAGKMSQGASFSAAGEVLDRWAMDFAAGTFRAVLREGWNSGARLQNWSMPTTAAANEQGKLDIQISETLTSAGFDSRYAYIVTSASRDPLWVVDTSDPTQPRLAGQLSMAGQLDFVEPRGSQLLALGHTNEAGQPFQLQSSLIDVSDPAHPALLSRVLFGSSYGWLNVQPDDLRKTFQVIDSMGLILVPFQTWDAKNFVLQGGTQLIDLLPTSLTLRGFLAHAGAITRAFPVASKLAALSDQSLQIIDATDRDHPVQLAELELARSVSTLAVIQGKAVELAGDWFLGATELAVTDAADPDSASPLARLEIAAPYARMFRVGNLVWLVATDYRNSPHSWVQGVDFSDPTNPRLRGRLDLGQLPGPIFSYSWGYGGDAVVVGNALVLHPQFSYFLRGGLNDSTCVGCSPNNGNVDALLVIDLSNPDDLQTTSVTLSDSSWSWGLRAFGPYAWLTHYQPQNNDYGRFFVDRLDVSDPKRPKLLSPINVPGVLFSADSSGKTLYTQEYDWHPSTPTTTIHKLTLVNDHTARLVGSVTLDGYPAGADANDRFAYLQVVSWNGQATTTNIAALDLQAMQVSSTVPIQTQWAWLMKAAGNTLFLQGGWYDQGVLLYNLSDPSRPRFDRFVRTDGYVEDIVVDGNTAYLPTGYYGVVRVSLDHL